MNRHVKSMLTTVLIVLFATGAVILLVFLTRGKGDDATVGYQAPTVFAMDTTLDINIQGLPEKDAKADAAAVAALAKSVEAHTSMFKQGSDVYLVNKNAGVSPVKVHPDTLLMVKRSLELSAMMEGAFDITVAPVVKLWGFYDKKYRVPSRQEIDAALPLVGYQKVIVDEAAGTVMLPLRGMEIDLGWIANGYVVGEMYKLLKERWVKSAVINFGGSVGAIGRRADGKQWVVGIKDPRGEPGDLIGEINLSDNFVNTSGDYERYFIQNGVRYCHLIDPRTGRQPRSTMSTTIVGPQAMNDDILSKVFVLGSEKGLELLGRLTGYDAVFVNSDGSIVRSPGMNKYAITIKEHI